MPDREARDDSYDYFAGVPEREAREHEIQRQDERYIEAVAQPIIFPLSNEYSSVYILVTLRVTLIVARLYSYSFTCGRYSPPRHVVSVSYFFLHFSNPRSASSPSARVCPGACEVSVLYFITKGGGGNLGRWERIGRAPSDKKVQHVISVRRVVCSTRPRSPHTATKTRETAPFYNRTHP